MYIYIYSYIHTYHFWTLRFHFSKLSTPLKKRNMEISSQTHRSFSESTHQKIWKFQGQLWLSFNLETPIHQYSSPSLECGHFALKCNLQNINNKKNDKNSHELLGIQRAWIWRRSSPEKLGDFSEINGQFLIVNLSFGVMSSHLSCHKFMKFV